MSSYLVETHRNNLLAILNTALKRVNGRKVVSDYLRAHPLQGKFYLIAVGKAAASMTDGALECLGEQLVRGLVITKFGHGKSWPAQAITCLEAGHPIPDERSLEAGRTLVEFIDAALQQNARFLFLISGGASALVEAPPEGVDARALAEVNRWLLGSGRDILQMNRVRQALSTIKGGRLAARLRGRETLNLLISDVPGDDPRAIGSGLLTAGEQLTVQKAALPPWINSLIRCALPLPNPDNPCFANVRTVIVASLADALRAAAEAAREKGYAVHLCEEIFSGDAIALGRQFAERLIKSEPGIYIWGGESTVRLPVQPGRGGRNQALALAAAMGIQDHANVLLLAAASDGTDGPTNDAGGLIDGASISRGKDEALDAAACLTKADAGRFLEASGDLIRTGPTGTNVMDLVLGLKSTFSSTCRHALRP